MSALNSEFEDGKMRDEKKKKKKNKNSDGDSRAHPYTSYTQSKSVDKCAKYQFLRNH